MNSAAEKEEFACWCYFTLRSIWARDPDIGGLKDPNPNSAVERLKYLWRGEFYKTEYLVVGNRLYEFKRDADLRNPTDHYFAYEWRVPDA